jgi:hypothetical protein
VGDRPSDGAADTLLLAYHRRDEQEHRMQSDLPTAGRAGISRTVTR